MGMVKASLVCLLLLAPPVDDAWLGTTPEEEALAAQNNDFLASRTVAETIAFRRTPGWTDGPVASERSAPRLNLAAGDQLVGLGSSFRPRLNALYVLMSLQR